MKSDDIRLQSRDEATCTWPGDVTWRETAQLREALLDTLDRNDAGIVNIDVRAVRTIDNTGIAMLIGANRRAIARGRRLVLLDCNGPVTAALSRLHIMRQFSITQVIAS
jgi:anti-anti-sigma regulatory factor